MYFNSLSIQPLRNLEVNNIEYSFFKQGSGPVIFFLHGFPDSAYTWDLVIDELSKSYTCIAPFLRGYYPTGFSKDGDYSVKSIANDIHEIANALEIDSYSIVGHDWGATIAYTMANLFPAEVERVCTIGMPHPKFLRPTLPLLIKARHILYLMNKKKSPDRMRRGHYSYLLKLYQRWSPNWKDFHGTYDQMVTDFNREGRVEAALEYYWQLKDKKETAENKALYNQLPTVPLLSCVGEKDGTILLKQFDQMKKGIPSDFDLATHPTAGHFLHLEESDFFINKLKTFLIAKTA